MMQGAWERHAPAWLSRMSLPGWSPALPGRCPRDAVVFALFFMLAATVATATCTGDCDGDGTVRVDELMRGVGIALLHETPASCSAVDADSDALVTVNELVAAVQHAVGGCAPPQGQAFVVATDFQRGSFATVTFGDPPAVSPARPERRIHQDAVVRASGGLVYVVNRFNADNIQVLDPTRDFATIMQCSVGNGANPHDIAFAGTTKAYVTRFGEKELYIVDPSVGFGCPGFLLGSIDLSPWADADGYPEMDQMAVIGARLYVSLQRLDRRDFLRPAETAAIVVIDTHTDTVIDKIPLTGENPFAQSKGLVVHDGALIVSEAGRFGVNDGGIERVDLDAGAAEGFFITEAELGGDITDFVLVSDDLGYAVISLPSFDNSLVRFDPKQGTVIDTVLSGRLFIADIELNDRGELYAADRATIRHGLRIFRASDAVELTPAPLYLVLPPFDIIFLE